MSTETSVQPATLQTLLDLPEDVRAEIIDGQLVYKASPSFEHSDAQTSMAMELSRSFKRPAGDDPPGGWWLGTEAEVVYESGQVYQHDLAGWRRKRVPDKLSGRPIEVLPDWACEILSPSNATNDTISKLRTLQRCGVPWYWIVDPLGGAITVYELRDGAYSVAGTGRRGERQRLPPFDAVEFDVGVLLGDDPAE